jgi:hypothetical protein
VHPARREGAARSLAHALRLDPTELPDHGRESEAPVPAPKHLRVAPTVSKKVLRQRRRARWAVAGVAAISAASMFLLVTFHVFAVGASFELDKLEARRADAQRRNELLRNEVASKSSAPFIFSAAVGLGMTRGDAAQITLPPVDVTVPKQPLTPVKTPDFPYPDVVARH